MEFDVQYLLFLQQLRNACGGCFDELFNAISKIAVDVMPLLPFMVFWCVDKKWGYRFITTIWLGEVVNGLIKLTVCAYRPWIKSDLIEPAGDSKVAATGYSFPSGHTMCATATYGTTAVWQYRKRRWLSITCIVMIFLTMFSRNILGVHMPQDVIVGFIETSLLVFAIGWGMSRMEGKEKMPEYLSIAGIALVVIALVYILLKPYPMDYVDGALLVDPQKMMKDTFSGCGGILGLIIASYLERHTIHFEIPKGSEFLAPMTAIGLGIVLSWDSYVAKATVIQMLGANWGNFVSSFIKLIFVVAVYPVFLMKVCSAQRAQETQ